MDSADPDSPAELPLEGHENLAEEQYDDSPWTRAELQALCWEVVENLE